VKTLLAAFSRTEQVFSRTTSAAAAPGAGQRSPAALVRASDHENLDLLPGGEHGLDPCEAVLSALRADYDAVFIDAAPALSPLAERVFDAADALLAPTIPTPLALRTLAETDGLLEQAGARALAALDRPQVAALVRLLDAIRTSASSTIHEESKQEKEK
jgi:cellulose biosynthesis protein BcsQ